MAFGDPIQWVVIGVVVIALFLWGPSKIPQLARSFGQARRELEQAQKEFQNPTDQAPKPQSTAQAEPSADEVLLRTARSLGISTEGKTREQIANEIVERAGQRS